jgi:hypothetical protein
MNKIILSGSFNIDEPAVKLAEVHSRGVDRDWMHKRAAVLTKEIADVKPEKGKSFIHLIAMGDSETYGPNRNADGFDKKANSTCHGTFVTNGHVYKNHVNKDPKKASGQVKASAYNPDMCRTELLISVDDDKWGPELKKLDKGEDISFSMACKVAHDVCSVCENKAPSRAQYCDHMKKHAGQILEDGKQVFVHNPNPSFFDISGVFRPADRIAYHLEKVASATVQTGADLAEEYGLTNPIEKAVTKYSSMRWEKQRVLRKLAEIEKEVECMAPAEAQIAAAFDSDAQPSISASENETLKSNKLEDILGMMGDMQISLPVKDFLRLVLDGEPMPDVEAVEGKLPGIFGKLLEEDGGECACSDGSYDPSSIGSMLLPKSAQNIIESMIPSMGLSEGPVGGRIQTTIIRKKPTVMLKSSADIHNLANNKDDLSADLWAREYAKYKLSFLTKVASREDGALVLKLGILQDYV